MIYQIQNIMSHRIILSVKCLSIRKRSIYEVIFALNTSILLRYLSLLWGWRSSGHRLIISLWFSSLKQSPGIGRRTAGQPSSFLSKQNWQIRGKKSRVYFWDKAVIIVKINSGVVSDIYSLNHSKKEMVLKDITSA